MLVLRFIQAILLTFLCVVAECMPLRRYLFFSQLDGLQQLKHPYKIPSSISPLYIIFESCERKTMDIFLGGDHEELDKGKLSKEAIQTCEPFP